MSVNNQALALAEKLGVQVDGQELINTLKSTAFKTNQPITNEQMSALLIVANQYNLNPWTKEVYAFPDKGGIVPIVGVDGWARIINSNKYFDGMKFVDNFNDKNELISVTCIIYRKDRSYPIEVTEYMSECCRPAFVRNNQEIKGPWQSHPFRMLRHKAMIQCARMAFGFTGIYDQDEAERIVEVSQPSQQSTQVNPANENERAELIAQGEEAAKLGIDSLLDFWMKTLTYDQRQILGTEERDRLKTLCPVDAEYSEVQSE